MQLNESIVCSSWKEVKNWWNYLQKLWVVYLTHFSLMPLLPSPCFFQIPLLSQLKNFESEHSGSGIMRQLSIKIGLNNICRTCLELSWSTFDYILPQCGDVNVNKKSSDCQLLFTMQRTLWFAISWILPCLLIR